VTSSKRKRSAAAVAVLALVLATTTLPDARAAEAKAAVNQTAKNLAKVSEQLRAGVAGKDPVVLTFLDEIERGEADAADLNTFAIHLAKKGMTASGLAVQEEALRLDPKNPALWLNAGTLHRDLGRRSDAMSDYKKVLSLDPNNALAHYNIGVLLDAAGNYDAAIEAYRTALTIDPSLTDPRKNPQILNNLHRTALSLLLYRQKAGALGLPLVAVPAPPAAPPAAPLATPPAPAETEGQR
jgi:tetratricopeptide (TPR) repeat protein